MSVSPLRALGLFAPVVFIAQAAQADLSAQDVWSDWKDYMGSTGYAVTASEAQSGKTLTVSDIQMTMNVEGETMALGLGAIDFVENGDGTVNVVLPAAFPMEFDITADGESMKGKLIYRHDGTPMVVSGDMSKMTYDYKAATASFSLDGLEIDGASVPADVAAFTMTLTDLANTTVMEIGEQRAYSQTLTTSGLDYTFMFKDPESDDSGTFTGALTDLNFDGTMVVPTVEDPTDIAALMKAGLAYDADITFGGGNTSINGVDGSDNFALQTTSQGGKANIQVSPAGFGYDFTQTDATVNVMGSQIPFPIALSMAELGMNMTMPLMKSEEEQDFALGLALRDFSVPEMLWGLIDPTGELPHDPATLVLDLTGKGKLAFDLTDEAQVAALDAGEAAPGELNALNLNELLLSVAGAELTGSGAFTFDNSDLESFDGMPAPEGEANLKLVGANGLIDKLIGMGLISEDDAMGARMMMGMFTVSAGDDVVTSKIEVNEEGHVLANGQRLK